ncbi:MAG: trigger factor [Bacteroidia bacterium]
MEISINKQEGLDAELSVKVNEADYAADLDKQLNEYRKKVNIPGFRQGKVPMGVVRKMFLKDAKRELIDKFLQRSIQDYISKNDVKLILNPLSTYNAEDIDWTKDELEFTYDIGLRPEINIDIEKLNQLTRYQIEASEEDIQEEIEKLRKQAGKVNHVDTVDRNNADLSVTIHFHELDDEGKEMEDGLHKVKLFTLAEVPAKLVDVIDGKEKGYKTTVKIADVLTADEMADIFGVDKSTIKDLNPDFEVEIRGIFTVEEPEMNQEFFDKYFEPGTVTSIEDFTAEWKKLFENYFNQQSENVLAREIKQAILDNTALDMPKNFLDKYMMLSYNAQNLADIENYDEKRKAFDDELKWLIISEYISEQQNITINEEDVIDYTKEMIRGEFGRSGMTDIEDKQLQEYAINYLTKENNFNRTSLALRDGKVFEHLLTQVQPKVEKINQKKFEELNRKQ